MNNKKVVGVKFQGNSQVYDFFTDLDLQVDDLVVCDTAIGFSTAKVAIIRDNASQICRKWIVQKIDIVAHKARLEHQKAIDQLMQQMNARKVEIERTMTFQILAKEDKQMAELFDQYAKLAGGN